MNLSRWLRSSNSQPVKLVWFPLAIATVVVAGLLTFIAAVALLWLMLDRPALTSGQPLTPQDQLDFVRIALIVTGGLGGIVALVVAYRKQRVAEDANRRAESEIRWAEEGNQRAIESNRRDKLRLLNERYAIAAGQLGHEAAAVRLAAVYALAGLADEWNQGRQVCIDVLCAYLRMPYQPDSKQPDWARGEREVRMAIISSIGDQLRIVQDADGDKRSWRGSDFDLSGAVFDGGDLTDAHFSGGTIRFENTTFVGGVVRFEGAVFSGARVLFGDARFIGGTVRFHNATFIAGTVGFYDADFRGGEVEFYNAEFQGADVHFIRSRFSGGSVPFDGARLKSGSISFMDAEFTGGSVDFANASFCGSAVDLSDTANYSIPPIFPSVGPILGLKLPNGSNIECDDPATG